MNFPKISIIVPSYNQGQYLEETLLSIINQDYPNLELFVVDGGSTDNSVAIIKKHEQHITWWVSEKDSGQSEAINKGMKRATGEIISWLNSDDLLTTGALIKIAQCFSTLPPGTGLVHGGVVLFNDKSELETRFNYLTPGIEGYLSGMVFSQPSAFFKKKYLDTVGYLNGDLHYGMDYDLFQRLSLVCEFFPVKDVFAKYRLHNQSKSVAESNKFIGDWKKTFINMCKNLGWCEELDFLKNTNLYKAESDYYHAFSFQPSSIVVSSINRKKTLYYHLGHILKDLYWNNRMDKAKRLMKIMKGNFSDVWINDDPRLAVVMSKLKIPEFILKVMKIIKGFFRKKNKSYYDFFRCHTYL